MIQLKVYDSPAKIKQFWIDLYETEPIKLTLSIEDITSADATSTYSKTFKVPGTRQNAEFFKNSFDVDGTLFDVTVKKPAEILVDGAEFKQGQVRLQRVYLNTELDRYDYELIFLGETRDFSSKIGDKGLCELQLLDLIGGATPGSPLQPADIIQSWQAYPEGLSLADGLHNGNIIFPLIDHGNSYDDAGVAEQSRISIDGPNRFTQAGHPVTLDRFKPMIRAKRIWDKIFEDAGYTYTSSFITSDLFHQMYVSAFGNTATVGWDSTLSSTTSNNIAYAQGELSNYSQLGPIFLPDAVNDPGSNLFDQIFVWLGSSYDGQAYTYYEVPSVGEYEIRGECFYSGYYETSDYQPYAIYSSLNLMSFPAGGGAPTYWAQSSAGHNETLQFNITLTTGQTGLDINGNPSTFDVGDKLFLILGDINGGNIDSLYTNDFIFEVVRAPGDYNPASSLECTYKQIDFIKDMLTAFRLVLSPDPNNIQNFIVEPWQTYINSGELYDWSDKLVEDKDFVIEPVFFSQLSEIDFKFQPAGDYANVYHQQAYAQPYGWLEFNANNDLLIGKREIKLNGIAPTILTNLEGTTPADNFNIPQLHTHSQEDTGLQHLPIKARTRFLFYNGLQPVNTHVWYFNGASPEAQNLYPLVSPYQEWPIQPQTLNLNWANDVQYWGTATGLNQNGSTLYSNYWSRYISFLYGKYSRRVTAFFVLNNIDLNTFSFDDTIFVNGTYYRPEKIIDVEIGAYTQVKVQLLTSNDFKPPIIPFQSLLECTAVGVPGPCALESGSITVTTNGTPGFTWQLSNGQTGAALTNNAPGLAPYTFTIPNVSAGTYTLSIEDSLGRTKQLIITVAASTASLVTATQLVTPASACDVCDGAIAVTPTGGTGPYTIEWNDGNTLFNRTGLCVGDYYYTVYDSLGCAQQSYIAEITCVPVEGDIWQFYRSSADCTQIFNETKNVFYPAFAAPPVFNHFYDLGAIGGGTIKGCWTPTNLTTDAANAVVLQEYLTCEECNNIPIPDQNYLMINCISGTTQIVAGQPGMTIGQVWTLVNLKGCFVVDSISDSAVTAFIQTGPYIDCNDCLGIPTQRNYIMERCDGVNVTIAQLPENAQIGQIWLLSNGYCYRVIEPTASDALLLVESGPYIDCSTCEGVPPEKYYYYNIAPYDPIESCTPGANLNQIVKSRFLIALGTTVELNNIAPEVQDIINDYTCYRLTSVQEFGFAQADIATIFESCDTCQNPTPVNACVVNYGASMTPCIGGSADDYMEGYIDLSDITPIEAQFILKVFYIPGTPNGNCGTTITDEIDLTVTVEAGQSQGLLTCPQAPFIDFNGATICSVQFISGTYPLCPPAPVGCVEYTIGGYDIGETIYLDCNGIEQTAYYNGPAASGFDATSFCATSIVSYYGSEPIVNGNQCTPDPALCTSWILENSAGSQSIQWSGFVCGTTTQTGGSIDPGQSIITGCIIDGTLEYTGAPIISINAIC